MVFFFTSANRGQKEDLQTLQNNVLRTCLRYKLLDRVSEVILHREGRIQSLEQRRNMQLLKLIYHQSKNPSNIKAPTRPTRAGEKIVFNIPTRCTTKYLNSPYYLGTQIWDNLPVDTQRMNSIRRFEKCVDSLYKVYRAANE